MKNGKLIVFEGIYGAGKIAVNLVNRLREELIRQGFEVYEIDSPDSGRAQLMGAQSLDSFWRYGLFKPDFFFELASRARVCSVIRDELRSGKVVLCKNFTLSSIAYAQIKGHDWFREDLNMLESRARGLHFGGEVIPNMTIYLDLPPEAALEELGERIDGLFAPDDIYKQQKCFLYELSKMPDDKKAILPATRTEEVLFNEALAVIEKVLK